MTDKSQDDQIISIVKSIFSQGTFVVETFNESVLVRLMELRGTPIENIENSYRDPDVDHAMWLADGVD
jgi:hypothetical protein